MIGLIVGKFVGIYLFTWLAIKCKLSSLVNGMTWSNLAGISMLGERYWFTTEEERAIQKHNKLFYRQLPEQEVFFKCFRLPKEGEEGVRLSAMEIYCKLQKNFPAALRGSNPNSFAKLLMGLGVERVHTRYGNQYRVVTL